MISLNLFHESIDDVFFDPVLENDIEAIALDMSIIEDAKSIRTDTLNKFVVDFTALGSVSVLTAMLLVMSILLMSFKDYVGVAYLSVVSLSTVAWIVVLKNFFSRDRPDSILRVIDITGLSFPSGHSFAAASLYITFAYYFGRSTQRIGHEILFYVLAVLFIALVGISRVYLGVHFPSDVIAGITGGLFWGLVCAAIFESFNSYRTHRMIMT